MVALTLLVSLALELITQPSQELARQLGESEAKNADLRRQIDEMLEQKKLSEQKNNEITSY